MYVRTILNSSLYIWTIIYFLEDGQYGRSQTQTHNNTEDMIAISPPPPHFRFQLGLEDGWGTIAPCSVIVYMSIILP